jgi:uncharacterized protein with FMN-binding domain
MRRTKLVIGATVAGLAGVLSFHSTAAPVSFGRPVGAAAGSPSPTGPTSTTAGPGGVGPPAPSRPSTTPSAPATSPSTAVAAPRSAVGGAVNYNYGILSVQATVSGTKLTNVTIASLDDGGNFRSQSIDQQSIPVLEQQALQAQSANIQGVSGASYTSAGFAQSLQSALTKLGFR